MTDTAAAAICTELPILLRPDPMRTVVRPFVPSDPEAFARDGHPRAERIVARVLTLSPAELTRQLERVKLSLDERHRDAEGMMRERFEAVKPYVPDADALSAEQRLLIGAYFSAEFSFESAALFNPSIVVHPDQPDDGSLRFLLSLRGIGEGHLSSVSFRTGSWAADGCVTIDPPTESAVPVTLAANDDAGDDDEVTLTCMGADSIAETVIFPIVESQSRGIEDLRLTELELEDGGRTYAGTFTALGAKGVRQEIMLSDDFRTFRMYPVQGDLSPGKGMALFPRQVDGRYLALGRQDNENLWLFRSDDLVTWDDGRKLMGPEFPWEYVQIGNCGSPIEIDEGWLVLTHGVGVVRNYCMGASLLDRDDPSRVLKRTPRPFLEPSPEDRDGYVPNVVYSCGALVRGRTMLLPYGIADDYTGVALVDLDALLAAME